MILTLGERTPRIPSWANIAPSGDLIGSVEISENASVWSQCVLRGDIEPIRMGTNTNIQDGTIVYTLHAKHYLHYKDEYPAPAGKSPSSPRRRRDAGS
jgi:carbonic anhydrase/acetyltransferase-like protein (isoleucine patch superfamily)